MRTATLLFALVGSTCWLFARPGPGLYFPLETGTRWTYSDDHYGTEREIEVLAGLNGSFRVRFGAREHLLRDTGASIEVELGDEGFVPFYQFDESSFLHRDFDDCDDSRRVEILDREVLVETPAGVFENCLVLEFGEPAYCDDAGTVREFWAPGVGLVKWSELNIAGEITFVLDSLTTPHQSQRVLFLRGDANADGSTDVSDAIFTLLYLFRGGQEPPCEQSGDCDDSGELDVSDGIYTLQYLFLGGPPPPRPFSACGEDLTDDLLTCESFSELSCPSQLVPTGRLVGTTACKGLERAVAAPNALDCIEYLMDGESTLKLTHVNAGFNCCPIIAVDITVEGDTIQIVETESFGPDGGCRCLCLFDLEMEIQNLEPGDYTIRVTEVLGDGLEFTASLVPGSTGSYCEPREQHPW